MRRYTCKYTKAGRVVLAIIPVALFFGQTLGETAIFARGTLIGIYIHTGGDFRPAKQVQGQLLDVNARSQAALIYSPYLGRRAYLRAGSVCD